MSYATTAEFYNYGIKQAALPDTVTEDNITEAIDAASSIADGYLSSRYRFPLTAWGKDLTKNVCAIAAFELISTQVGFNPESGHNLMIVERKNDATRWLERISYGHISPPDIVDSSAIRPNSPRVYSKTSRNW